MKRYVLGIRLKIPDNEAHTALATLQRLAVPVSGIEHVDVWDFETSGTLQELVGAVEKNEALFNANKHEVVPFAQAMPRDGEVWIENIEHSVDVRRLFTGKAVAGVVRARRFTAWRLFGENGEASDGTVVQMAVERLLCNPAIERAII